MTALIEILDRNPDSLSKGNLLRKRKIEKHVFLSMKTKNLRKWVTRFCFWET